MNCKFCGNSMTDSYSPVNPTIVQKYSCYDCGAVYTAYISGRSEWREPGGKEKVNIIKNETIASQNMALSIISHVQKGDINEIIKIAKKLIKYENKGVE